MSATWILAVWVILLTYLGSRRRQGFGSWGMFAELKMTLFNLEVRRQGHDDWQTLNPWEYLPHTSISMSLSQAKAFLLYLREVHGLEIRGCLTVFEDMARQELPVVNGELREPCGP